MTQTASTQTMEAREQSLTASGQPMHTITLRRGDGMVIRYEVPESVLRSVSTRPYARR